MTVTIGRRKLLVALGGGAIAWPLAARAQQAAMPVIGLLTSRAPGDTPQLLAAVRQGLKETGFVEGPPRAFQPRPPLPFCTGFIAPCLPTETDTRQWHRACPA